NYMTYSNAVAVWYYVSYYIIALSTMLNVSLLAVIYSKKNLRAGAGLLISHLVVVDLLVILVAFPANISQTQNQPVSNFSCAAAQTFTYVLWGAALGWLKLCPVGVEANTMYMPRGFNSDRT
ncbi:hypothetical protein BV898_20062, partial [Hypsibius exemplaris]